MIWKLYLLYDDTSICVGIFSIPTSNLSCTEFITSASDRFDTNVMANPFVPIDQLDPPVNKIEYDIV